jgi:hypothetical protein
MGKISSDISVRIFEKPDLEIGATSGMKGLNHATLLFHQEVFGTSAPHATTFDGKVDYAISGRQSFLTKNPNNIY